MGTPDFAAGILQALIDSDCEVAAAFSQPDKPKGRGKAVAMTPVHALAEEAGVPHFQTARIREAENVERIRALRPDFIVVAAFGQIIPQAVLDIPPLGCLNVHASLLPRWRGAAPIQWSLIAGDSETGVTIMRMDAGLDTGDMILKKTVPIAADETGGSLFDKLARAGAELLPEAMRAIADGTAVYEKQPAESPTPYAGMITKQMGRIDWSLSAEEIERRVRGFDPWPGAYTFAGGKMLKIRRARVVEESAEAAASAGDGNMPVSGTDAGAAASGSAASADAGSAPACGTIVRVTKDTMEIQTGRGRLALETVQPEGKRAMSCAEFLRGYRQQEGTLLG